MSFHTSTPHKDEEEGSSSSCSYSTDSFDHCCHCDASNGIGKSVTSLRLGYIIIGHGNGDGFMLEIDANESIQSLMKKIIEEHSEFAGLAVHDLKLYLGLKQDGKWLSNNAHDAVKLSEGDVGVTSKYIREDARMRRSLQLSSFEFFDDLKTKPRRVHFLVVVSQKSENCDESKLKSPIAFDEIDTAIGRIMREKLQMSFGYFNFTEVAPNDLSIPGFVWLPGIAESNQKASILSYLRQHAVFAPKFSKMTYHIEDAETEMNLLDLRDDRLPFSFEGTTDVVIVDELAKTYENLLVNLRMIIMVRADIKPEHKDQMFARLACASILSASSWGPLALLTNLNNVWDFLWFDKDRKFIHARVTNPARAFQIIQDTVIVSGISLPISFWTNLKNIL